MRALLGGNTGLDALGHHGAELVNCGAAVRAIPRPHLLPFTVPSPEHVMHVMVAIIAIRCGCMDGPHNGEVPRLCHVLGDSFGKSQTLGRGDRVGQGHDDLAGRTRVHPLFGSVKSLGEGGGSTVSRTSEASFDQPALAGEVELAPAGYVACGRARDISAHPGG